MDTAYHLKTCVVSHVWLRSMSKTDTPKNLENDLKKLMNILNLRELSHRIDELFFLDLPVFYQEKKDYIQRLNEIVLDKEIELLSFPQQLESEKS